MQVSSFGSFGPGVASSVGGASSSTGSSPSASPTAFDSSGNSVVQEFLDYAKMNPMDRLRASILKSLGITQQQLDAMPPAEKQAVNQKIEQLIQQALQQNPNKAGQLVDLSA